MRIGVIGAGHAGIEAAQAASEAGADQVVLFSDERELPYYRPRLVMVAFGQEQVQKILIHPPQWYTERRIEVRLGHVVAGYSAKRRIVFTPTGEQLEFDGLVVATGAEPVLPAFCSGAPKGVMSLWTEREAQRVCQRVGPGKRIVIIGGGGIGTEASVRAAVTGLEPILVEKQDRLMAPQFNVAASDTVLRHLDALHVRTLLGRAAVKAQDLPDGDVLIRLDDGQEFKACLALVAVGSRPRLAEAASAGLKIDKGICTDRFLHASEPNVFACGDGVEIEGVVHASAVSASAQGKDAGHNVVAAIKGLPLREHVPLPRQFLFKCDRFELVSVGDMAAEGRQEVRLPGCEDMNYRSVIVENDIVVGLQMVGSRKDFPKYLKLIREKGRLADLADTAATGG